MDAALLLVAGNESCPQPQTSEHLAAIEIMKLKHIIILQNKIDLVKENQAKEQYDQIIKFVQGKYLFTLLKYQIYLCHNKPLFVVVICNESYYHILNFDANYGCR